MELSERLLKFLDLDKPEDDADFQDFLTEFEISAKRTDKDIWQYDCRELGFSLTYNRSLGIFEGLCFHILTAAVAEGAFKRYSGLLPFGITTSDTRNEVRLKLGVAPIRSTPFEGYPDKKTCSSCEGYATWWDTYNLPTLTIGVIFRSPLGDMDMFAAHPAEKRFMEKISEYEIASAECEKDNKIFCRDQPSHSYSQPAVRTQSATAFSIGAVGEPHEHIQRVGSTQCQSNGACREGSSKNRSSSHRH